MEHINFDENHDVQSIEELYTLYAIVVHQGYSSDGGHYFTYAKVPKKSGQISASNDDLWYIFNDSNVKYSNFESFLRDSKKFPADTAYVLFYQKIDNEPSLEIQTSTASKGSLPKELKMLVERDNIKFMREKERSALSSSNSSSSSKGKSAKISFVLLSMYYISYRLNYV
jgi:ubiquitin carboxyl-terminal hydrolase 35/38